MSRIEATIKNVNLLGEKALIAYVMAGDPNLEESGRIILEVEKAGADIIEIGVPFSDPVADGPTIQKAAERALKHNVSLGDILDLVARLRHQTKVPLILMSYANPIFVYGIEGFFKAAKKSGINGVIIPDLPPEEAKVFLLHARRQLIDMIFLVAPTSTPERAGKIVKTGSGFVYYVPLTGVTGSKLGDKTSIGKRVETLKSMTDLPVAAGFGISSPEDAKSLSKDADGIIVGSAIVRIIETAGSDPDYLNSLTRFVASLKGAIRTD